VYADAQLHNLVLNENGFYTGTQFSSFPSFFLYFAWTAIADI
jgi:hypothetical protein